MVRFLAPWGGRTTRGSAPVTARTLIRYAGALFVVDSAYTALTQVDVLMISALLTAGAVGQFGAVLRLLILLSYVGQAVAGGVSPRLARGRGAVPDVGLFHWSLRGLVVFQGMLVAPMIVWAHPIVTLLLGPGYHESVGVMRALAPSAFLLAFSSVTSIGANYLGLAGRRVPISAGALLFGIISTYILLKAIGLLGAAIADDAVLLIYVGAHLWIVHRAVGLDLASLRRSFARTFLAALAMSIPLLIAGTGHLSPLAWIFGGLAGVAAFAATLMLTGELSRSELGAIMRFIGTRAGRADRSGYRPPRVPPVVRRLAARRSPVMFPAAVVVALMLLWAVHNGGYDAETWYWGALCCWRCWRGVVGLGRHVPLARADGRGAGRVRPVRRVVVPVDRLGASPGRRARGQQPSAAVPTACSR